MRRGGLFIMRWGGLKHNNLYNLVFSLRVMVDLERLNRNKEGILSSIRLNGPSLPVRIARAVGLSPLFAAAFLSELKAEQKVKISNMRVGSSPIYYLEGQEEKLEGFVEHLNSREREAFLLLKESQVLEDNLQVPVVRVALRAIKDFAVPVKIRVDGELKLFWKYFLLEDEGVGGFVKKGVKQEKKKIVEKTLEVPDRRAHPTRGHAREQLEDSTRVTRSPTLKVKKEEVKEEEKKEVVREKEHHEIQQGLVKDGIVKSKKKVVEYEFGRNVKDYLSGRDIEVLEVMADKKREFVAKVRVDGMFGKQSFYLVSKDKKIVTDNDLVVVLQKAQAEKMTGLIMCGGELSKRAREHLGEWGNLIKFERLNF